MVTERDAVFSWDQMLASSNMPKPQSRFPASLTTHPSDCGEERRELKVADGVCNLFSLLLLPNTHPLFAFLAQKAQESWLQVALKRGSAVGWWGAEGTPGIGYRPKCHGLADTCQSRLAGGPVAGMGESVPRPQPGLHGHGHSGWSPRRLRKPRPAST